MGCWFTSDLHLNHKLAFRERPEFSSMEEMNDAIFKMFDVIKKGDDVYILGDLGWDPEIVQQLFNFLIMKKKANGVYVIIGNHDDNWMRKVTDHPRIHYCQTMFLKPQIKNGYHGVFLSHYPQIIFDKSHYGAFQLHGHGHSTTSDRPLLDALVMGKRLNVNCELHGFKLWSRDDVEEYMKTLPANIDNILCRGSERQQNKVKRMLKKINRILRGLNDIQLDDVQTSSTSNKSGPVVV